MSAPATIEEAVAIIEKAAATDPVQCNGCTACCRGNQAVVIKESRGDKPEDYGEQNLQVELYHGQWALTLKRRANGDCIFLGLAVCNIHAKRPAVCREFDCRRTVKLLNPRQRTEAQRRGLFSREILTAGMKRLDTLNLLPEEAHAYEQDETGSTATARMLLGIRP